MKFRDRPNLQIPTLLLGLLIGLFGACSAPTSDDVEQAVRRFEVVVQDYRLAYTGSKHLRSGYGPQRESIAFGHTKTDHAVSRIGAAAGMKTVSTYFGGVVGDFRDFDLTINVSIVRFDEPTMSDSASVLDYLQAALPETLVLKDGSAARIRGAAHIERIGTRDIVIAESVDLHRIERVQLANGAFTTLAPFQVYVWRFDSQYAVWIKAEHHNSQVLSATWYSSVRNMVEEMIQSMSITRLK